MTFHRQPIDPRAVSHRRVASPMSPSYTPGDEGSRSVLVATCDDRRMTPVDGLGRLAIRTEGEFVVCYLDLDSSSGAVSVTARRVAIIHRTVLDEDPAFADSWRDGLRRWYERRVRDFYPGLRTSLVSPDEGKADA